MPRANVFLFTLLDKKMMLIHCCIATSLGRAGIHISQRNCGWCNMHKCFVMCCKYNLCKLPLQITFDAQLGLGIKQSLLNLLWLCDVHLKHGQARGAATPQMLGSLTICVHYRGKHLEPHSVQTPCRGMPKPRVTPFRRRKRKC